MPNTRFKFSDVAIRQLPFSEAQTFAWDTGFPTLGLRIGKRSKAFIAMRPNGKRLTLGKFPQLTLANARQRLAAILRDQYAAPADAKSAPSASDAVEQYLQSHALKTRFNTHKAAKRVLNHRFLPRFKDRPINLITSRDLTSLIDSLLTTPSEAIKTHAVISAFMTWARRNDYVDANPLSGMPLPAKQKTRDRVLTDAELAAILKAALKIINTPYGAIVIILAHTGLRKSEAYKLKWEYITQDLITIPKELAKNNVEHALPNLIRGYLASIPKTSPLLFPLPIIWHRAKAQFDKLCGVNDWVLHDLRRTLSTKMAEWEIAPPDVVEAILNHKSGSRSQIQRTYDRHTRLPQMRRALGEYADRLA